MDEIITERTGSILRIQLNRPEKKNALTASMYTALANIITSSDQDDTLKVILIHGAGDSFCAGNDLADFIKNPLGPVDSPQTQFIYAMIDCSKPIVAAVHGAVVGVGATMLTQCDFVYAGESSKFQLPFINLALVPEFGSSFSMPAQMGYLRAAELILLGKFFNATQAAELGLVTRIVPDNILLQSATETVQELTKKPSNSLQSCKKLMKQSSIEQLKKAVAVEAKEFSSCLQSANTKEAIAAFLEKRQPNFT